jgi:NADH:ubiquinone oxidoreductase subunit 6 (subunit J)
MLNFSILFCISDLLYTYYYLCFLLCGLILLVAILGVILLSQFNLNDVKTQNSYSQLL